MASGDLLNAATNAVKVVPMFAPMINGNAFLKDTLSVATNGTIKEVVVVLEWIKAVTNIPQEKAFMGPPKTYRSSVFWDSPINEFLNSAINKRMDKNSIANETKKFMDG